MTNIVVRFGIWPREVSREEHGIDIRLRYVGWAAYRTRQRSQPHKELWGGFSLVIYIVKHEDEAQIPPSLARFPQRLAELNGQLAYMLAPGWGGHAKSPRNVARGALEEMSHRDALGRGHNGIMKPAGRLVLASIVERLEQALCHSRLARRLDAVKDDISERSGGSLLRQVPPVSLGTLIRGVVGTTNRCKGR